MQDKFDVAPKFVFPSVCPMPALTTIAKAFLSIYPMSITLLSALHYQFLYVMRYIDDGGPPNIQI